MPAIDQQAAQAAGDLLNYGVLGIVAVLLLAAVIVFWRLDRNRSKEDRVRISKLEDEQTKYLAEDRLLLTKTVEACNKALDNNSEALAQNSKVMAKLESYLDKH